MNDRNLYAPPAAQVVDVQPLSSLGEGVFVPGGRRVSAGHGWAWFVAAWRLFKSRALVWWFVLILSMGGMILLSIVPLINFVVMIGFPVLMAGIGACADSCRRTGTFDVGSLFVGFSERTGQLLLLGVLTLVATLVGFAVLMLVVGGGAGVLSLYLGDMESRQAASAGMMAGMGGVGALLYMLMMAALMSMVVFSPYLIHQRGMSAVQAIRESVLGSLRNVGAGLVAAIVYFGLAIVATIPLALGWLVLLPVVFLVGYTAYRDVFFEA